MPYRAGSSPLTRGKHNRARRAGVEVGLIPAHAGKTGRFAPRGRSDRAHPRSRGENTAPVTPPPKGPRLIPAHAGKTDILQITNALKQGSSPLTRGKPVDQEAARRTNGLIPAHAGKTPRRHRRCPRAPAHPRSRGENTS